MTQNFLSKIIFSLLACLVLSACDQQKKDIDQASDIGGGRCFLKKDGHNYLCLQFIQDSDSNTNDATCTSLLNSYLGTYSGGRGQDFLSGNANTCVSATSDTVQASCTRSDGVMYYYASDWSNGSSQADCTTQSGTWAQ